MENGSATVQFFGGETVFSGSKNVGYPLSVMMDAFAYIIASKTGNLNGKRPKGSRNNIISSALNENPAFTVTIKVPDLLTPLVVTDGKVSAMVGPLNEEVYQKLISYPTNNRNKMVIRKITEADLR